MNKLIAEAAGKRRIKQVSKLNEARRVYMKFNEFMLA